MMGMVSTPAKPRSHCPINFGLEIFGDRWTLLILRDALLLGKTLFKQFQSSEEGIATNILADRLQRLEQCGLLTRSSSPDDARQAVYRPTDAARKLIPVLVEMSYWGASHDSKTAAPAEFVKAYDQDRDGLIEHIAKGFNPTKAGR